MRDWIKTLNKKLQQPIALRITWVIIGACALLGLAVIIFVAQKGSDMWVGKPIQVDHDRRARLLDGMPVASSTAALTPFAIMIENHVDSRPAIGLEDASIIYETIVEGNITRYLAIFDYTVDVKKIGPVRSARPFFVNLAEEWSPVYFHAGGSPEALALLRESKMVNVNEISSDGIYFWRDTSRGAPHNLYTAASQLQRALQAKGVSTTAEFSPWLFKLDQAVAADVAVATTTIAWSSDTNYLVEYIYNQPSNNYTRYLGGRIHVLENGSILKAKNIIVQHTTAKILDDYGRLDVDVESGGAAEIYLDGKKIDGRWEKIDGRTRFYDSANQEIRFNRGTIWVEIVFE